MSATFLQMAIVFLVAALIAVPLAKRLGLGSVLGYLIAGVVIGPSILGFIGEEGEDIMHASEFGVVMMLFLIGLELNPQSFWRMRKLIMGLGGAQVLFTTLLIFPIFYLLFRFSIQASLIVAISFALSSTAIVLQTLKEKGLSDSPAGKASFAVLLLQDIAVIPVLAIMPLLAPAASSGEAESSSVWSVLFSLGALGILIVAGRFAVNPFLRLIAKTRMPELFTAAALFIVVGVAYLMYLAGISAALGAFVAGVLLANSEFRHELESDVEPFKGLLLGLFFTAVGSTINFNLIAENLLMISTIVALVIFIKSAVLLLLGYRFKLSFVQVSVFAVMLSQVGEFAFILLSGSSQLGIMDAHQSEICIAVTTITMAISPIMIFVNEKFIAPKVIGVDQAPEIPADTIEEKNKVIIAGFGHYGSTIGRFLRANGVPATILDYDSERVGFLRKMGFKVYFGDATKHELLIAAGAHDAKLLICALDSEEKSILLAELASKHFPHLKLFIRTKHRFHSYELMKNGQERTYRESLHGSVFMGVDVLHELGMRNYTATRKAQEFIKYDEQAMQRLVHHYGSGDQYIISAREEIELQERLLSEDVRFINNSEDNAWDSEEMRDAARKANEVK